MRFIYVFDCIFQIKVRKQNDIVVFIFLSDARLVSLSSKITILIYGYN